MKHHHSDSLLVQFLVFVLLLFFFAVLTVLHNAQKESHCARNGGQFVKNIGDATQSTCIMGR